MPRCMILPAYILGDIKKMLAEERYDYLICADGGYRHAETAGLTPDLIIGDFDSAEFPIGKEKIVISVPVEKDDTDTMLCVKKALELGYKDLVILGGIGGRLDHTFANIQTLAYAAGRGARACLRDAYNEVHLLLPGSYILPKYDGKLSLFAYSEEVLGLSIHGVHYPLENASIDQFFPIGTSNEIIEDFAEVSFTDGILLMILSKENENE